MLSLEVIAANVNACIECGEHSPKPGRICNHNGQRIEDNAAADECPNPKGRKYGSRGAGDSIAKVISTVTGKQPCGGCAKRRAKLNKLIPYKR